MAGGCWKARGCSSGLARGCGRAPLRLPARDRQGASLGGAGLAPEEAGSREGLLGGPRAACSLRPLLWTPAAHAGILPTMSRRPVCSEAWNNYFEHIFFLSFHFLGLVILQVTGYGTPDFWPNVVQCP